MYDARVVLQHLSSLPASDNMTMKQLTYRLVTLMALLSAQRSQTLHVLDINYMHKEEDKYIFYIPILLKTSRPSSHQEPLIFLSFPEDPNICVVKNLNAYLERTKDIRRDCNKLSLSLSSPHKEVSSATIARWVKGTLAESGIDTQTFSAHSTRSAATSLAKTKGLSISDIAKAAGWCNDHTFARHYNKPIANNTNFGRLVQSL